MTDRVREDLVEALRDVLPALSRPAPINLGEMERLAREVETVARTFYTARVKASGFDLHGVCEVDWDDLPEDMKADYRAGAKAALGPLTERLRAAEGALAKGSQAISSAELLARTDFTKGAIDDRGGGRGA